MTNDLTTGRPAKLILSFSVPLLIGNIFQQLYSMADTVIVGRTIGVGALAAVGSTGAISFLILGFVQGLTSGFAVITAQRFGANDEQGVRRSVATGILLSIAATLLVTAIAVWTTRPLLRLMNTPADIFEEAYQYIVLIYWGIWAAVFYNLISCIIRALGDSRTPLLFLIVASILNIILDIVFIQSFHMGVGGAAWATVLAQAIAGLLCLWYCAKRFPILRLKKSDWKFDWDFTWKHLRVGLPMAFQFSITAVGVMVLQGALNRFGSVTVAAFTAASKINQLATQPMNSFGMTMATYAAQNYGAGNYQRVREGVRKCNLISLLFALGGGLLVVLLGKPFVYLFVDNPSAQVLDQAQIYLIVVAIFYFALALLFVYRNTLQGMGYSGITMWAGATELLMRVLAVMWLPRPFGYVGVCLADPVAWIGAAVILFFFYYRIMRRLKPAPQNEENPA